MLAFITWRLYYRAGSFTKNCDKDSIFQLQHITSIQHITDNMSSSETSYLGAKMLCIMLIISLMGTRSVVNGGVVIPGHLLSNNRPSSLVSAATAIHTASQSGQITPAQAQQQAQYLIQANKDKVNLALINGIGR